MYSKRFAAVGAVSVMLALTPLSSTAHADDTDPEALVNALNAIFGSHPGKRAAHTHGFCVKGAFVPSDDAAKLSKAPHLTGKGPWPVTGRFSMGGGDPNASNAQKDNVRALAIHIDLGGGNQTDMVTISAPIFAAKTPAKFLELLQTVASKDKERSAPSSRPTRNPPCRNHGSMRAPFPRATPRRTTSASTPSRWSTLRARSRS